MHVVGWNGEGSVDRARVGMHEFRPGRIPDPERTSAMRAIRALHATVVFPLIARGRLLGAYTVEYLLLGAATALFGVLSGSLAGSTPFLRTHTSLAKSHVSEVRVSRSMSTP